MSFLYPRTITVRRPNKPTGGGKRPYGGVTAADETVVLTGLPASIQQKSSRQSRQGTGLPSDASTLLGWHVFIPKAAAAKGDIVSRDVLVDDLGNRYTVFAPYWNSLGHNLLCELEEV